MDKADKKYNLRSKPVWICFIIVDDGGNVTFIDLLLPKVLLTCIMRFC